MPLDAYVAERVPAVLARPGVERATWWRNVHRDRTDLPRVLPEFDHLGVFEVADEFRTPTAPAGISGHHFRRYRRPGQGMLTGRPTVGLSLVLISPEDPARAQELRDWADFVHIRHIAEAAVPGYAMITPYENVTGGDPRFMHFYEMDTDDPERAFKSHDPARDASASAAPAPTRSSSGRSGRACASCTSTASCASAKRDRRDRPRSSSPSSAASGRAATFSPDPVADAEIAQLLTAATYAPSAENRQPWEFVVVRGCGRASGDRRAHPPGVGERTDARSRRRASHRELLAEVDRGATGGLATAPVTIVVCADTQRGLEATVPSSIFPAVQNLLLAATALGLGSALTTIATGFRAELTALLDLPAHVVPVAVVPVGRPARPLGPPRREPFAEHTHREQYGKAW